MKKRATKNENTGHQAANGSPEKKAGAGVQLPFGDRRPQTLAQGKLQAMMDGSTRAKQLSALQKKANNTTVQTKESVAGESKHGSPGGVVQRVKDEGLRMDTDPEIDALKERAILILEQMQKKGSDWKTKWGEAAKTKVKEKAKAKLNGEKGESIESMVAKKIWENLTPEEKWKVCTKVATEGMRAIATAIREAPEMGESGKKKPKEEPKPKTKEEPEDSGVMGKVLGLVGELSADDLKAMYDFMKEYREIKGKVDKAKSEIVQELGKIGQGVGEFVGEMRDEQEFEKLIAEFKQEYVGASSKYQELKAKILSNEDSGRYNDELYALQQALEFKPGIWAAMFSNGNMIPKYRIAFPELCKMNIEDIRSARRDLVDAHKQKGMRSLIMSIESPPVGDSKLPVAMERASSALKRVVHQSWSKVTKWKSVPDGVSALRELSRALDAKAYLEAAKAIEFGKAGSNRDTITAELYGTIIGLNLSSVAILDQATEAFNKAESDLRKKE